MTRCGEEASSLAHNQEIVGLTPTGASFVPTNNRGDKISDFCLHDLPTKEDSEEVNRQAESLARLVYGFVFLVCALFSGVAHAQVQDQYVDWSRACGGGNNGTIGAPYCDCAEFSAQARNLNAEGTSVRANFTGSTGTKSCAITGAWNTTGRFIELVGLNIQTTTSAGGPYSWIFDTSVNNIRVRNATLIKNSASASANLLRVQAGVTGFLLERSTVGFGASWTSDGGNEAIQLNGSGAVRNTIFYDLKGSVRSIVVPTANGGAFDFDNSTMAGSVSAMFVLENSGSSTGAVYNFRNNIMTGCGGACYAANAGSGSLTTASNITSDATSPQVGGRSQTINYLDAANKNFRLAASATNAINQGTTIGAFSNDIDGTTRPQGAAWDIGAHEVILAVALPGCGRMSDPFAAATNLCPGADQDADGFTVAQGDCDDTRFGIRPGISTTVGCSGGQWRTCKADGTGWTACSGATWTPTGDSRRFTDQNCTDVKYFSPTGNNTTGDGSFANPWRSLTKISTSFATRYTPADGFCGVMLGGVYSDTQASTQQRSQLNIRNIDCAINRCMVINYPGTIPVVRITDTTTNCYSTVDDGCGKLYLEDSDNWTISGLEVDGQDVDEGYGFDARLRSRGLRVVDNNIHNMDGVNNNNLAGIRFDQGADGFIRWNYVRDICDTQHGFGCEASNTSGIDLYTALDSPLVRNRVQYNNLINTVKSGRGIRVKQSAFDAETVFQGNYISNIVLGIDNGGRNSVITNNLIVNVSDRAADSVRGGGVIVQNPGNLSFFGNAQIASNTIHGQSALIQLVPFRTFNTDNSAAADKCSGNWSTGVVTLDRNVLVNTSTGFGNETGLIVIDTYGPDSLRSDYFVTNRTPSDNNCLWTPNTSADPFSEYAGNNAVLTCAGTGVNGARYTLAGWRATGRDVNSVNADPGLNSVFLSPSTCAAYGYRNNWPTLGAQGGSPNRMLLLGVD